MFEAAQTFFAVTPSDTVDLPKVPRKGLMVGVAGNLHFHDVGGNEVTVAVAAGYNPLVVTRIYATGTTATGILALVS